MRLRFYGIQRYSGCDSVPRASPLLIDEQFRVTNHVYEQNMSDVQVEMRSGFRGHVGKRARRGVQHCQTVGASRAETNEYGASGIKAAFAEGQKKTPSGSSPDWHYTERPIKRTGIKDQRSEIVRRWLTLRREHHRASLDNWRRSWDWKRLLSDMLRG
jgi:hypothetical protein